MVRRLVITIAAAFLIGAPAAHATMLGENGKIAYTSTSPCCSIHTLTPSPNPAQRNDTNLTAAQADAVAAAWSSDGTKIAYTERDSPSDPFRIWVMNQDGSGKTQLSQQADPAYGDYSPTWSPDGTRIAWVRSCQGCVTNEVWVMDSDGANAHRLFFNFAEQLRWSPDGSKFATSGNSYLAVVNADGTNDVFLGSGRAPSWSPSGEWIAYDDAFTIKRITPNGTSGPNQDYPAIDPAWSPDGRYLAVVHEDTSTTSSTEHIFVRPEGVTVQGGVPTSGFVVADNGENPDWQPLPPFVRPPGYVRPRGAGLMSVPLVPAYQSCDVPNTTHGPPLAFGSCAPPAQESSTLTAGTPDANGQAPNFVGRATLTPIVGNPSTPRDEADVRLAISLSDVRCQAGGVPGCDAPLSDYSGSLRGTFDLTITDKNNGGSGVETATVKTIPYYSPALPVTVPCVPTADPAVGSTCSVSTTADAIAGNVTPEGKRSTWAIGQVELWDSGPDGNVNSDDNTLFAVQGVFVP